MNKISKRKIYTIDEENPFKSLKGLLAGFLVGNIFVFPLIFKFIMTGVNENSKYLFHTSFGVIIVIFSLFLSLFLAYSGWKGGQTMDIFFLSLSAIFLFISLMLLPIIEIFNNMTVLNIIISGRTKEIYIQWVLIGIMCFSILVLWGIINFPFLPHYHNFTTISTLLTQFSIAIEATLLSLYSFDNFIFSSFIAIITFFILFKIERNERKSVIQIIVSHFKTHAIPFDVTRIGNCSKIRILSPTEFAYLVTDVENAFPSEKFRMKITNGKYLISTSHENQRIDWYRPWEYLNRGRIIYIAVCEYKKKPSLKKRNPLILVPMVFFSNLVILIYLLIIILSKDFIHRIIFISLLIVVLYAEIAFVFLYVWNPVDINKRILRLKMMLGYAFSIFLLALAITLVVVLFFPTPASFRTLSSDLYIIFIGFNVGLLLMKVTFLHPNFQIFLYEFYSHSIMIFFEKGILLSKDLRASIYLKLKEETFIPYSDIDRIEIQAPWKERLTTSDLSFNFRIVSHYDEVFFISSDNFKKYMNKPTTKELQTVFELLKRTSALLSNSASYLEDGSIILKKKKFLDII